MKQLKIEFLDYWHAGTGFGKGALVDSVVEKNSMGLPFLPGKTIKGILRESVRGAGQFNWIDKELETTLFGTRSSADNDTQRSNTQAGVLQISDACLEPELTAWFKHNPEKIQMLFKQIYQTAINNKSTVKDNQGDGWGTATDKSLRGIEVTVPLTLYSDINITTPELVEPAINALKQSISLITAMGAGRSRGLGRVSVELVNEKEG